MQEMQRILEKDHDEALQRESERFQSKIAQVKQLNAVLSQKLSLAEKAHEDLVIATEEITQLKDDLMKVQLESEELANKCYELEQTNIQLQAKSNQTRNEIVDNYENERNIVEDKLINYQIDLKAKDGQILTLQHEVKILEQRLKQKLTEMSLHRQKISESFQDGQK